MKAEKVSVLLPYHENITGAVSWVDGLAFGLELDRDLDPQALVDAIQRQNEMTSETTDWEVRRLHRVTTQLVEPSKFRRI